MGLRFGEIDGINEVKRKNAPKPDKKILFREIIYFVRNGFAATTPQNREFSQTAPIRIDPFFESPALF